MSSSLPPRKVIAGGSGADQSDVSNAPSIHGPINLYFRFHDAGHWHVLWMGLGVRCDGSGAEGAESGLVAARSAAGAVHVSSVGGCC